MATAAEVRWIHYSPEERMGRYTPSRGMDGHMQYLPRDPGDTARNADHLMYRERDPREIETMFDRRIRPANEGGAPGEFTRVAQLGSGHVQHADPSMLDEAHKASKSARASTSRGGYFGEESIHSQVAKEAPRLMCLRSRALDGVHQADGTYRSIRDLVAQLWFDDGDEATAGAQGLADLTVPSNPHAPANRELIGATPTVFEGLERLVRSGNPNTAYQACEALSQLAFRNHRNGQRIMTCFSPHLRSSLSDLLDFEHPVMDGESKSELVAAVLRVFNNCAWNGRQACIEIAEDHVLMDRVEEGLRQGSSKAFDGDKPPLPLLMSLDAAVGLLSHLASEPRSRDVLLQRRVGEDVLLPLVAASDQLADPPEQYLCTVAGAVEVVIKLIWDADKPAFLPHTTVLQTIVWTLVCSLDGVMWAGITWSSLGRVQTLSKLAAHDPLKITLIDLNCVEALVRLLDQWTVEQGTVVLEEGLMCLLHLLTIEEGRFRMYLSGVYRPFRSIILGDEGATELAKERSVLCSWMLFEWQVAKLESLDRKCKELMASLEESERARLAAENEYARDRARWLLEVEKIRGERDALRERHEALVSEHDATCKALVREQSLHAEARGRIKALEGEVEERDAVIERLEREKSGLEGEVDHWRRRALDAESLVKLERAERERMMQERDKAVQYAEVRFTELQVESLAREVAEKESEAARGEMTAAVSARAAAERSRADAEQKLETREAVAQNMVRKMEVDAERAIHEEELRSREAKELLARLFSRHQASCKIVAALRREHEDILLARQSCSCGALGRYRAGSAVSSWGGMEEAALRRSAPEGVYAAAKGWDTRRGRELRLANGGGSRGGGERPKSAHELGRWGFDWQEARPGVDVRVSRRTREYGVGDAEWRELSRADDEVTRDVRGLIDSWRKTLPAQSAEEAKALRREIDAAPCTDAEEATSLTTGARESGRYQMV